MISQMAIKINEMTSIEGW